MTGHHRAVRNIMVVAALFNISMNLILIPSMGLYGAAFSSMLTLALWNLTSLFYIKHKYGCTTGYLPFLNKNYVSLNS